MNNPAAASAAYTDSYVSSFDVDIHKPDKRNALFRQYGNQGLTFFQLLDTLGNITPSTQTQVSHFEEDWIHETLVAGSAVAAGAAGAAITIPIDSSTVDSEGNFYVREGDVILFPSRAVGVVTAVNKTSGSESATVVPHDETEVLGPVASGQNLVIFSNEFNERTGNPEGRVTKPLEFFFKHQIIKETIEVSGSEMTNKSWIDKDSDGRSINAWHLKGEQVDLDYRFALAVDGASLFNKPINNPALGGLRSMTGLIPWIKSGGNEAFYTPGTLTIADFDAMTRRLDKYFAPGEHLGMLGIGLFQNIENLFLDSFEQNPVIYANGSRKGQKIDIDVKQLIKTDRKYNFKKMDSFNHPKLYGANGYNIDGLGVWIPMGTTKDSKTKQQLPYVGMRYKELNGVSRRVKTWMTGSAGVDRPTNDIDERVMNQRAELASQFCAVRSFYLWEAL